MKINDKISIIKVDYNPEEGIVADKKYLAVDEDGDYFYVYFTQETLDKLFERYLENLQNENNNRM